MSAPHTHSLPANGGCSMYVSAPAHRGGNFHGTKRMPLILKKLILNIISSVATASSHTALPFRRTATLSSETQGFRTSLTRRKGSAAYELFLEILRCSLRVLVPAHRVPDSQGTTFNPLILMEILFDMISGFGTESAYGTGIRHARRKLFVLQCALFGNRPRNQLRGVATCRSGTSARAAPDRWRPRTVHRLSSWCQRFPARQRASRWVNSVSRGWLRTACVVPP